MWCDYYLKLSDIVVKYVCMYGYYMVEMCKNEIFMVGICMDEICMVDVWVGYLFCYSNSFLYFIYVKRVLRRVGFNFVIGGVFYINILKFY